VKALTGPSQPVQESFHEQHLRKEGLKGDDVEKSVEGGSASHLEEPQELKDEKAS